MYTFVSLSDHNDILTLLAAVWLGGLQGEWSSYLEGDVV